MFRLRAIQSVATHPKRRNRVKCTFKVSGKPRPKKRPRVTGSGAYTPSATKEYEERVGWFGRRSRPKGWPENGYYQLRVEIVYPDHRVADGDNVVKAIKDGLEGVLWKNDCRVRKVAYETLVDRDVDDGGYVRIQAITLTKAQCERQR